MAENLKKIRELMVSSQFNAGIELALTLGDKYLLLELVEECEIGENGTITLNETFATNAFYFSIADGENYDILVGAFFKIILKINDILMPESSLKTENIKVLALHSFDKLPSGITAFTNLKTIFVTSDHSKSIPDEYFAIDGLEIKNILLKQELIATIWAKDKIYYQTYETKVNHSEADYIENEGLGCERLKDIDKNADDYDPNESEKIKINVSSYVDDNYRDNFFNNVDSDELESGIVSKDDINRWIGTSLYSLCQLFREFVVIGGEKLYPDLGINTWENPKTIYLEVEIPNVTLQDLNPEWTDDEYYLDDEKMEDFIDDIM